ncbi:UxaA family hydrolase [Roseobacter weihaiensis]|uniref:UxaA family hydrolase n=1 Tax=Roseobacter weihaiensis TaxID=2763262 RepID=UPI0029CABEA3|nr:UxaA family hydrolase [Roseobacter sp. H9]
MTKAKPSAALGARLSLQAHSRDNVATLLDAQLECATIASGLAIDRGIPFGHKVALCRIAKGSEVIKYGVVIGRATSAIRQGEHVHVHNIA